MLLLELFQPGGIVDLGLGFSKRASIHARLLLDFGIRHVPAPMLLVSQPISQRLVDIRDLAFGLLDWRVAAFLRVEPLVFATKDL